MFLTQMMSPMSLLFDFATSIKVAGGTPVRLYGAKEPSKNQENIFPDPHQYTETKKGQQGKGKGQKG
jgi:hypothetical protein